MSLLEQGKAIDKRHNTGCPLCDFIEEQPKARQAEIDELINTRNKKGDDYVVGHTAVANVLAGLHLETTAWAVAAHRRKGHRVSK